MKITNLEVFNYRNLDGVKVALAPDCNFLVGENNLGKTNLLLLLNYLFTSRTFRFEDFCLPASNRLNYDFSYLGILTLPTSSIRFSAS